MSLIGICAPIANPVYSNDVPRVLRIGLDFVPQVRDVAVKGAVEHGPAVVRTELDEVIARERLARMSGEHLEQAVLSRRESDGLAANVLLRGLCDRGESCRVAGRREARVPGSAGSPQPCAAARPSPGRRPRAG